MQLTQLLLERFHVNAADIERAVSFQKRYGGRLELILVNMGSLPDDQVPALLSEYLGLPLLNILEWQEVPAPAIEAESLSLLLEHQWVPLAVTDTNWIFACRFPLELSVNEWHPLMFQQ